MLSIEVLACQCYIPSQWLPVTIYSITMNIIIELNIHVHVGMTWPRFHEINFMTK